MIKIFLFPIYYLGKIFGRYKTFIADYNLNNPPIFRYPHLISLAKYFKYNSEIDCFILKNLNDAEKVAKKIIANEITVYELVNEKAKLLHLDDFLGYKPSNWEKLGALLSVTWMYIKNKFHFIFSIEIESIKTNDFEIKDDFKALDKFQNNFNKTNAIFVKIKNLNKIFQIGVTLKGTNFVFVDSHFSTLLQELYHCNYHFEEGIRGFNNDNKYIIETWGNVPWLYLMQTLFGRIERRIRKNQTPHDIKFIDYVYWRAYIGQGYELKNLDNKKPIFHGVYALIAPTAKLLFNSIQGSIKEKNDLLINAIFKGPAPKIKEYINEFLGGDGRFEKIFHNFGLFDRLNSLNEIIQENNLNQQEIYKILFNDKELVPTLLNYKLVALIWFSKKLNSNKKLITDLLENFYNQKLKLNEKIHISDWIKYLEQKNNGLANLVKDEFKKHQIQIDKL